MPVTPAEDREFTPGRVVVASDGTESALRGVAFAAREAGRLGVPLQVVHVVPAYLPVGSLPMVPDDSLQQPAHDVLERSRAAAAEAAGDVEVLTTMASGRRVEGLVRAAEGAAVLVLGARPLTLSERIWTGTTAAGVAARSSVPVLVVPADERTPGTGPRVVAGVKSPEHEGALLAQAFAVAADLGARLTLVHVWRMPTGYDDIVMQRIVGEEWRATHTTAIEQAVADLRTQWPDVETDVRIVHGQAAHVLVEQSRDALRLLLSRPVHGGLVHHLGATARAVLREAHCPVEVVAPQGSHRAGARAADAAQAVAGQVTAP